MCLQLNASSSLFPAPSFFAIPRMESLREKGMDRGKSRVEIISFREMPFDFFQQMGLNI